MKIGFFGNTNNYPLTLAQGFQALGHEVVLVINRKELINRPESKYPAWEGNYPDWVHDYSHIPESDFICESTTIGPVLNLLDSCDVLIMNHIGPSLAHFFPKPTIALMTGSDVTFYANLKTVDARLMACTPEHRKTVGAAHNSAQWTRFITRQREGIRKSDLVGVFAPGLIREFDELLNEIGVKITQRFSLHFGSTHELRYKELPKHSRFRILNGARLNWIMPYPAGFTSLDYKATDILLKGFKEFLGDKKDVELVLFEKGLHINETHNLVDSLNLAENVIWLPETSLNRFYEEIANSHVICDQLGESFIGMGGYDAMTIGRAVVGNFRMDIMGDVFPESLPVCQAKTAPEVAAQFERLYGARSLCEEIGKSAHEFAQRNLTPEYNARKCLDLLSLN